MTHATTIDRFPGTLGELATELGDLRYDALAEFLGALAAKLIADAGNDFARGRPQLAAALQTSGVHVAGAADAIDTAWRICEPRMRGG